MDPTDKQALAQALAATYSSASELDSWTLVQQYRRVRDYTAAHPDKGSAAVASALDLPRSRLRAWVDDDGRPDAVRGIETAEANGWLDCAWRGPTLTALTVLVAWTFSGGTIQRNWQPAWTCEAGTRADLATALDALGLGVTLRNTEADTRATEVLPGRDANVVGRLCVALGAPQGAKSDADSPRLPAWLTGDDCPYLHRLNFARVVVRNRGVPRPERPNTPVQLREERTQAYHAALRRFLGAVVGDRAMVRGGAESGTTFLTEEAAAVLCPPPVLTGWLPERD